MAASHPEPDRSSGFAALCLGQFLGHQTGLTFSALIPIVSAEWQLSASQAGLILGAFQLGNLIAYVVVGFLLDRMRTKPIMAWAAALVAMGDLLFALGARDFWSGIGLRLLVGVCLGGLYLPALKHIAETIPTARRATATGVFIGVLVAGYAGSLFYVGALATRIGWRLTMAGVGAAELLGALVLAFGVSATQPTRGGEGRTRYLADVFTNRPALCVIGAYTAHNWELFGMWGWTTPFMVALLQARGTGPAAALTWGGMLAAGIVGVGGLGGILGGRLADRFGRARAARALLGMSFFCSAIFGWLFHAPLALILAVSLVYGIVVVADSPAYSASLMELVPPRSLGGAFSLQMLFGWTVTAISPAVFGATMDLTRHLWGDAMMPWGIAYGILALGPIAGILALWPLARREGRIVRNFP
ncbi:MAG: MFS transporter [candidate division NC10 bacterium]|nr:MFS transporter [candidate division NC10 bacterium]